MNIAAENLSTSKKPLDIQNFSTLSDEEINRMVAKELGESLDPVTSYCTDPITAFRLAFLEFITIKHDFMFDAWLATPTPYDRRQDDEFDFITDAVDQHLKSQQHYRNHTKAAWTIEALHPARAVCLAFLLIRGVLTLAPGIPESGPYRGQRFDQDILNLTIARKAMTLR